MTGGGGTENSNDPNTALTKSVVTYTAYEMVHCSESHPWWTIYHNKSSPFHTGKYLVRQILCPGVLLYDSKRHFCQKRARLCVLFSCVCFMIFSYKTKRGGDFLILHNTERANGPSSHSQTWRRKKKKHTKKIVFLSFFLSFPFFFFFFKLSRDL